MPWLYLQHLEDSLRESEQVLRIQNLPQEEVSLTLWSALRGFT